jgi:Zn-dependent protease
MVRLRSAGRLSLESDLVDDHCVRVDTPPYDPGRDRRGDPFPPPLPNVPASVRPGPAAGGGRIGWQGWLLTAASMAVSVAFYAFQWSWPFATVFVALILVHEFGHLVAARRFGLRTGPPIFIPMMGAFISLKQRPANAWEEAVVGIGGPLFGTFAAGVCLMVRNATGDPFWGELAFYGFMLNLFNLAPAGFLDGGRIVTAISPWLWIPGYALMAAFIVFTAVVQRSLPVVSIYILLTGLPRLFSLFRERDTFEQRYYAIDPGQKLNMGIAYFGLIVLLAGGLYVARPLP